jgi:hypothetical protein
MRKVLLGLVAGLLIGSPAPSSVGEVVEEYEAVCAGYLDRPPPGFLVST